MEISAESLKHFKNLIRLDTSNPPGNEMLAIDYLKDVFDREGLPAFVQKTDSQRGNIVVRLKSQAGGRALMLHSHVDVVTVERDKWKHDPFSATEDSGFIYGRGAIDMKNFTAQTLGVVLAAHREKWPLKRDLVFVAVSDEEAGSNFGMKALVEKHPEQLDAEYGLGEVGGATVHIGGKPFYPVQVAEKGVLWLDLTFKGAPGHGSIPQPTNAHWQVGQFLSRLEKANLPPHLTRSTRAFLGALKAAQSPLGKLAFELLETPLGPRLLKKRIWKSQGQASQNAALLAMLTNTVNPTGLQSGRQHNVVPSTALLRLDCRVIPGVSPEEVVAEIKSAVQMNFDYTIFSSNAGHETEIDTPLFQLIRKNVESAHPGARVIPSLTVGFTDASQLTRLGIKCYGFSPVRLPPDVVFSDLYHGHNERIPIDGFVWGLDVLMKTVREFCT